MKRLIYLDWLRVIATVAVVAIHVTAGPVGSIKPGHTSEWLEANLFESISRWAVPVFVMISGALLLNDKKELSFKEFLKKRANRVVIPFVGWSALFYLYGVYAGYYPLSIKHAVKLFITNGISYHLWFLYMIVGLYLITPLLQVFVRNARKQHIQYFLLLWLYASVVTRLCDFWIHAHLSIELFFTTDYVGYFLLGYYLAHFEISERWRKLAYAGAVLGFIGTFLSTYYYTVKGNGQLEQYWYSYFAPGVLLCSVGLFIWFRYSFENKAPKLPLFLQWINQVSLGVYIIHYWLMQNFLWKEYPLVAAHVFPMIVLPIDIVMTLLLSILISVVLKWIPYVRRLIS